MLLILWLKVINFFIFFIIYLLAIVTNNLKQLEDDDEDDNNDFEVQENDRKGVSLDIPKKEEKKKGCC